VNIFEHKRGPARATRPTPIVRDRDVVDLPFLPHGGSLAQILAWAEYWSFDLGLTIGRQFEEYLRAITGDGSGPIDLPDGAPVDSPQPPSAA
jgi:hypothetical protein